MRHLPMISAVALSAALFAGQANAQTSAASPAAPAAAPAAAATPPADPVVATVNGNPIHMSDVQAAAQNLPQQMQQLPPDQLFPLLVNQLVDRQALLAAATSENLQKDPKIQAAMQAAANEKLENAYVQEKVDAQVSDTAIQAAYNQDYAGKPGPAQVQARHILVKTEAEADAIIKQLEHGADFAKLATKDSIDPGAKDGGELGWFSQNEMVPEFSNAAFALKPGQYTKTPVHSQFGWHIILCEGKRTGPTPSLDEVKDQIRQNLADTAIKATLTDVRSKVKIQQFNPDGTPVQAPASSAPGAAPSATPGTAPGQ